MAITEMFFEKDIEKDFESEEKNYKEVGNDKEPTNDSHNETSDSAEENTVEENTSQHIEDNKSNPEEEEKKQSENYESRYKAAMYEERSKRKELEKKIEEFNKKLLSIENEKEEKKKEEEYEESPIEYIKSKTERIERELRQQQENSNLQRRQKDFIDEYGRQAKTFSEKQSDFFEAYNFLCNTRINQYCAAGYSKEDAVRILQNDEVAIASKSFNDGVNPAERVYLMAKAAGYSPSRQQSGSESETDSNFERIRKGVKASSSLTGARGMSEKAYTENDWINEADDEKFNEYWDQMMSRKSKGF